ncbi:MAG: hypothetical protein HY319_05905 [Armatimonadetes bacterium]|nr:hypothetical protein [Armatimonadota bacterium]
MILVLFWLVLTPFVGAHPAGCADCAECCSPHDSGCSMSSCHPFAPADLSGMLLPAGMTAPAAPLSAVVLPLQTPELRRAVPAARSRSPGDSGLLTLLHLVLPPPSA